MSIWFKKDIVLHEMVHITKNTMIEHLGMDVTEIGDTFLKGTMPVDHRTCQPAGLLHGGASVALAERWQSFACSGKQTSTRPRANRQEDL